MLLPFKFSLGEPEPEVKWYKGDKQIKPKKKDKRVKTDWDLNEDIYLLEILDCTVEDAAEYTVKATNDGGVESATVTVLTCPISYP